jgi:phenylpropionate dioxygenase-like ring-hydroxylating dioxygenase large terminal subunit
LTHLISAVRLLLRWCFTSAESNEKLGTLDRRYLSDSARKTRLFCPLARNFNKDGPLDEVHAFNLQIFNEDRVIVESQKPEDLPLDMQMETHIPADRTSIAYRKLLKSMGLGRMYVS